MEDLFARLFRELYGTADAASEYRELSLEERLVLED